MKTFNYLFVALMLVSCSKIEKFEKQTQSMEKTTKDLSGKTDSVKLTTSTMYEQFRSIHSRGIRQQNLQAIKNAEGMGEKLVAAAVYFKSFEFQLWTKMESVDDEYTRELMFLDAANEITQILCDFHKKINIKKMGPTREDNNEMNFYALAATAHMNHTYQELLVAKDNIDEISMYSLITTSLMKRHNRDSMKEYEEPFVNGPVRQVMTDFLKARIDIISALALRNLTDKKKMNIFKKLSGGLFKVTGGFFGGINVPVIYDPTDYVTNKFTITYLKAAVIARQLLQELREGEAVKLEKTIRSAFEHIELKTREDKLTGVTIVDDTKDQIKFLINGLL